MNDSDRKLLTEALGLKWLDYPEGNLTFGGFILHNPEFNTESELELILDNGPEQKWWADFCTALPNKGSLKAILHPVKFPNRIVNFLKNGKRPASVMYI
jgi:hypothetical protein